MLKRLATPSVDSEAMLAHIEETTRLEYEESSEAVGFTECFKGTDLRRTTISCMVYAIQPLAANFFVIAYPTYFFELAGLATADAFDLTVGLLAVGFVGTCLSWPLIARLGRRTIYNSGLYFCTFLLLLIGVLDVVPNYINRPNVIWAQSSMMVVYNFFYDLTFGPLCFVIICETSSAKLRGKTIALATAVNALINLACAVGIPYAINPDQGNLRGKLAFIFLGTAVLSCIYCYFCLPETKGRTFEELVSMYLQSVRSCADIVQDVMFQRKVKTKDFKNYDFASE